jgi:hypothetical protein
MMKKEHRPNNSSLNLRTHSSSTSRQLSNQKLMKSTNINDAKQMLLIHELRKKKTLPLATIEDSLCRPTLLHITKTIDSQ